MRRCKTLIGALFVVSLLASPSTAGIRPPGEYNGVVVFDRWGGCTLSSGPYVMYIAEGEKARLKEHAGRCVRLNATQVYQPHNPGDGSIVQFTYLGPTRRAKVPVSELQIGVVRAFEDGQKPAFLITVRNVGKERLQIQSSDLAPTLLVYQGPSERARLSGLLSNLHSPSDGPSIALITRESFWIGDEARWQSGRRRNGESYSWTIGKENALPKQITLGPGASRRIKIWFGLGTGEYDFFCGYGRINEFQCLASNLVAFNVDGQRRGKAVAVPGR